MTLQTADARDPVTPYFKFQMVGTGKEAGGLQQVFALRYEVYCLECGFLPAEQFQNGLESDEYDAAATHFVARNLENEAVGTLRVVQPTTSQSFPFEHHCKSLFHDIVLPRREECCEISRLVVRKNYRRRSGDSLAGVSQAFLSDPAPDLMGAGASVERRSNNPQILLGLYREAYRYSVQSGIRYWYAAMEKTLARALASFEFVFNPIGMETDYYGPVTPYLADLRELEERVGATNPQLMAWFRGDLSRASRPEIH